MKLIRKLSQNEKVLLIVLVLQLTVYWLCILGTVQQSQFIAYQRF